MKKFILSFCVMVSISPKTWSVDQGPILPLQYPEKVAWIFSSITTQAGQSKTQSPQVFIADGDRWRIESRSRSGQSVVFVYDGDDLRSNRELKRKDADALDNRIHHKKAYKKLSMSNYKGTDYVGSRKCWHFVIKESDGNSDLWIDVETKFPRKISVQYNDGMNLVDTYDELSVTFNESLFKGDNLEPRLVSFLEAR